MVARAGVQPATFALGVRCSMQLSYRAILGSVFGVGLVAGWAMCNPTHANDKAVVMDGAPCRVLRTGILRTHVRKSGHGAPSVVVM